MKCDNRLEQLHALIQGGLEPADRDATLRHLEECGDCRGLFAALVDASLAPEDGDLVDSILARTCGTACDRAIALLPERLDGALDDVDRELVNRHLDRCSNCREISAILLRAQESLPLLAEIDPGPGFVEGVLDRTSRRPKREPLMDPFVTFLSNLVHRRRIAWEGAFVATLCLAVPIAAPGSPLAKLPAHALGIVREVPQQPAEAFDLLRASLADLESPVARGSAAAWDSAGTVVVRSSSAVWSGLSKSSSESWSVISRSFGTFVDSVASGQRSNENDPRQDAPGQDQEKNR